VPGAPPFFFMKPPSTTLVGPGRTVRIPEGCRNFDWEVEFVVVFGRGGKNIREKHAMKHVAGYSVGIDFTARDLFFRDERFFKFDFVLGKCQDTIKIHSHGMAAADAARVQWKLPFEDGMNLGIHFFGSEALGDIPGRSSREARVETPEEFEDIIIDFYYHDQHGDWHNQSLRHTHKHHQEATSFQLTDLGRMHRPKDFLDLGIKPYKVERN